MDFLYQNHQKTITKLKTEFRRDFIDQIDWDERMIAIKGARGVGKTTLMLQYIKETHKTANQALFVSMDDIQVSGLSIWEIAEYHYNQGGTHLYIDEIHKYDNWSIELKNIYDRLGGLSVCFSSSSILQVYKGYADLSRRVVSYQLHGLSLREYIQIETKTRFEKYTFQEISKNHVEISTQIIERIKPLAYFNEYLKMGYFPFYLQSKKSYYQKLTTILGVTLEVDLPYILDINIHNVGKLKRLIKVIAGAVPFQPNISKLAESVDLTRNTLTQYLYYLEQAEIINLLTVNTKSYSHLTKPEKIFLQNPNLAHAINWETVNRGTLRELFFLNQLKTTQQVNFTKIGDFLVNEKYIFEIGGSTKTFAQIADIEDSYLAVDEIEIGHKNKIPLWLFGFLY
ncbi:ATP-binding protein [Lacihabitans soyangensis]|uniref:AAA family ATPase n=1 Tax=Lacihabitans soyangensis TaxID=869394 RepID=A0AAE3H2K8_9BACT|nr:AAA family ATPase [Lacihabitans soyangensis]MCP9762811.1 AAA family ATPase [Lacihabitans soyangensis]